MIHFSASEVESQERPFLVVGRCVVDPLDGSIMLDLDDYATSERDFYAVRSQIDWKRSLERMEGGKNDRISRLLSVFAVLYPDFPDFVPGWVDWSQPAGESMGDAAPAGGTPIDRAALRGLSNYNKVPKVIIKNKLTGELITIDRRQARISRMRKRVFSWADAIKPILDRPGYRKVMITLTYAKVEDWQPNHIRDYVKALKRKLGSNLHACAWVAELQERGAVHYHMILICKKGTRIPMPDKSGMWAHGMSKIETAKTIYYICSYLKKEYQKMGDFPKGLRMFSIWIADGVISTLQRWYMRLSSLPAWFAGEVRLLAQFAGQKWERLRGGGFWWGGQVWRSPYAFMGLQSES